MKLCSKCGVEKEESEFNKKTKGKLQPTCRICQQERARKQYAENKEHQIKLIHKARKARKVKLQEYILTLFASGCVDCGIKDPRVLEWDHVDGKTRDISQLIAWGVSLERLNNELDKCDLICANCHRIRTYNRNPCYKNKE